MEGYLVLKMWLLGERGEIDDEMEVVVVASEAERGGGC